MRYADQLKSPKWQRRRLEILQRADFMCEMCGTGERTLHVHHRRYSGRRTAWEYGDHELVALCDECHVKAHATKEVIDRIACRGHAYHEQEAAALLAAFAGADAGFGAQEMQGAYDESPGAFVAGSIAAVAIQLSMEDMLAVLLVALSRTNLTSFPEESPALRAIRMARAMNFEAAEWGLDALQSACRIQFGDGAVDATERELAA